VIFTDGYGYYPSEPPTYHVLWVISPDGMSPERDKRYWSEAERIGEIVKMT